MALTSRRSEHDVTWLGVGSGVSFVALIVLDPLTVVLVGSVQRAGIWLAAGVISLDIAANWIGNWPRITGAPAVLLETELALITAFGVFVLASSLALLRLMRPEREAAPSPA